MLSHLRHAIGDVQLQAIFKTFFGLFVVLLFVCLAFFILLEPCCIACLTASSGMSTSTSKTNFRIVLSASLTPISQSKYFTVFATGSYINAGGPRFSAAEQMAVATRTPVSLSMRPPSFSAMTQTFLYTPTRISTCVEDFVCCWLAFPFLRRAVSITVRNSFFLNAELGPLKALYPARCSGVQLRRKCCAVFASSIFGMVRK